LIQEKREEKEKNCVYFCAEVVNIAQKKVSSSIIHFAYYFFEGENG
jgi:hypothetical protein